MQIPTSNRLGATLLTTLLLTSTAAAGDGWYHLEPFQPDLGGANSQAGGVVELSRDWAFTSAFSPELGRVVQVYRRSGGTFEPVQVIESPDPDNLGFANRILLEGDVLFVADASYDVEIGQDVGAVRVYRLVDGGWELTQSLFDTVIEHEDRFGYSIAADGPWLAVGVHQDHDDPGHVAMFREVDGTYVHETDLASGYGPNLGFSVAVQASEDGQSVHVLAGVPYFDHLGLQHSGAVVPFQVSPGQSWSGAALQAEGLESHDRFGVSMTFAGDKLIVGADGVTADHTDDGAVFVYDVDTTGLLPQFSFVERLTPGSASAGFGMDVDYDAESGRLAVGAPYAYTAPDNKPGQVYVFRPEIFGNGFDLEEELWHTGGDWGDQLGRRVAVSGRWIFSGANHGGDLAGAYLFSLNAKLGGEGLAPASFLAVADPYGPTTGPEFTANTPPIPGQTAVIGVSPATPGHLPFVVGGTAPAEIPLFGATLLIADPNVLVLPPVTQFGSIGAGWNVPNDPVMHGATFYAQFWFVDPFALPALEVEASNGLRFTVGV